MKIRPIMYIILLLIMVQTVYSKQIGFVDTAFKIFGPDHKIVIDTFSDSDVKNVTCYISHAKTGGIKSSFGLSEDTADAAISCLQVGPVRLNKKITNGKSQGNIVFQKRISPIFKKLRVARFYDKKHNALVYLAYSDKVIEGSPKNSLSAVLLTP